MKRKFIPMNKRAGWLLIALLALMTGKNGLAQPDLTLDLNYLMNTIFIQGSYFAEECEFNEGCTLSQGFVKALRFGTRSMNVGTEDLILGDPTQQPDIFVFDPCHQHYHFGTYANYQLYDLDCNDLGLGHKFGFCITNLQSIDGTPTSCEVCPNSTACGGYNCSYQGLGVGCADIYNQFLDCQLLDISNVPDGRYIFEMTVNFALELPESDFTNNTTYLMLQINGNNLTVEKGFLGDPMTLELADLDNQSPPSNTVEELTIATDTVAISGTTTMAYAGDREVIAGRAISIKPGNGKVTISAAQGGSTSLKIIPCVASFDPPPASNLIAAEPPSTTASANNLTVHSNPMPLFPDKENLRIFPNPSQDGHFNVSIPESMIDGAELLIYDSRGKKVMNRRIREEATLEVDLSAFPQGMYLVNVIGETGLLSGKVAVY